MNGKNIGFTKAKEGLAHFYVSRDEKISKDLPVFYNPVMKLNRDISILLLDAYEKSGLQVADPLAATGVRSIRFLMELGGRKIKSIDINDNDIESIRVIRKNLGLNRIDKKKVRLNNLEASIFLLGSSGFDYIDIDPFGTPNPFLDAACKRISREGILAITATDTAALCGTARQACIRKYWAVPNKGPIMHELGLRILIRKVQLIGAQFEKALIPVFSYSKDHYMRVFLRNFKGKGKVDFLLSNHQFFDGAGPLWTGKLWDASLCDRMYKKSLANNLFSKDGQLIKFLKIIKEESNINSIGFHDIHYICEKLKIKEALSKDIIKSKIKKSGYMVSDTHFKGEGIRSNIPHEDLIKILKNRKK